MSQVKELTAYQIEEIVGDEIVKIGEEEHRLALTANAERQREEEQNAKIHIAIADINQSTALVLSKNDTLRNMVLQHQSKSTIDGNAFVLVEKANSEPHVCYLCIFILGEGNSRIYRVRLYEGYWDRREGPAIPVTDFSHLPDHWIAIINSLRDPAYLARALVRAYHNK